MKITLILIIATISLPYYATAFLFGVQLTNNAGGVIAGANPAQTAGLIGLGVLGAAAGVAGLSALNQATRPRPATRRGRYRGRHYRRGKRQTEDVPLITDNYGFMNEVFEAMAARQLDDCFQRFVCDISSKSFNFQGVSPIIDNVKESQDSVLSPVAFIVSRKLMSAINFGETHKNVQLCEEEFNHCQWNGDQMKEATLAVENQITFDNQIK